MLARSSFTETRRVGSQPPFDSVLSETHCWQQQFSFGFFVNKSFFCILQKTSVLQTKLVFCFWTISCAEPSEDILIFHKVSCLLEFMRILWEFIREIVAFQGVERRVVLTEIRVLTAMSSQERSVFWRVYDGFWRFYRSFRISQCNFILKPKALIKWIWQA